MRRHALALAKRHQYRGEIMHEKYFANLRVADFDGFKTGKVAGTWRLSVICQRGARGLSSALYLCCRPIALNI